MRHYNNSRQLYPLGGGTLRSPRGFSATEEEAGITRTATRRYSDHDDGFRLKPKGRLEPDDIARKGNASLRETEKRQRLRIGTWNARTMLKRGKLENVKLEMRRMRMNILGLSEVRWKGVGDYMSGDVRVIYAGGEESQRGVAVILDQEAAKRVVKVIQHSDRLILVKVQAEPVDLVFIQIYMPTTEHDDSEVEELYDAVEELLKKEKGHDYVVVMGDWNAVVGEGRDKEEVGCFGYGERNDRGQMLVEFSRRNKMIITNTWFEHEKRRRYTWKKAGDAGRYQLDYILVRQRYRNSVKNARSYPGVDIDSDHNLVMMTVAVRLKQNMKRSKRRKKWKLEGIEGKAADFNEGILRELQGGNDGQQRTVEEDWKAFREAVKKSAE